MSFEKNQNITENLSLSLKVKILFLDYIILVVIISILDAIALTGLEKEYVWLFWLSVYILYCVFPEFIFKRTLGMKLFKVSLKPKKLNDFKNVFLLYSVLVLFDRFLILVVYLFGVLLLTDRNLLVSEKFSGLRWRNA
jgi:hypothetical protein